MQTPVLNRRTALSLGLFGGVVPAVLGTGVLAGLSGATPAAAETPMGFAGTAVYTRPFGSGRIVTISDGVFALDLSLVTNLPPAELESALASSYLPKAGPIPLPIAVHLIQLADRTLLVDAGAGGAFGPSSGRLGAALAAGGVPADTITDLFVSHLHPDHIGGLMSGSDIVFPNAQLHLPEADIGYWADEANGNAAPDAFKPFFALARAVVASYGDRVVRYSGEVDLGGGVRGIPLHGHTVGHSGLHLSDGGDEVLICGDAVAIAAYQFTHPEAGIAFDMDGQKAAETRKALLSRAAADRVLVAATHLPFPGFGHVEQKGDAFAWVPEEWKMG
jgi:glyoxylase-like metal-dependent hydrolase (beta-lactamase superfamily II)